MFNHILRNTTGTYLVIDSGKQYLKTKQIQNQSIRKKKAFMTRNPKTRNQTAET